MKTVLPFIVVVVFAILAIIFLPVKLIKISKITCESQFGPCSSRLQKSLEFEGALPLGVAKEKVNEILDKEFLVETYTTRFQIPSTLQIYVVEKKPDVAVTREGLNIFALVDGEGLVIALEEESSLPKLVLLDFEKPDVGESLGKKEVFWGRILYELFLSHGSKLGKEIDNGLEVEIENGIKVIFPTSGDVDVLLGSLELILSRLNEDAKDPRIYNTKLIDLRFKNPVLK